MCARFSLPKPAILVETGTYHGDGIQSNILDFEEIHSIELHPEHCRNAQKRFKEYYHVHVHEGDSATVMASLVETIKEPAIFYLDAHYSGGNTAYGIVPEEKGCPVLRELEILGKRQYDDIVVVDDMRLMGKCQFSGTEGDHLYPLTEFDWRHVTFEKMLETYGKRCTVYQCHDFDRIVLYPQSHS